MNRSGAASPGPWVHDSIRLTMRLRQSGQDGSAQLDPRDVQLPGPDCVASASAMQRPDLLVGRCMAQRIESHR